MRQRVLVVAIGVVVLSAVVAGVVPADAATSAASPTTREQCRHGGWRGLSDEQGTSFANQRACVDWLLAHPIGLDAVTGTFNGHEEFEFGAGCSFVHQDLFMTYASANPSIGAVDLTISGCVDELTTTFVGEFTLETAVGSVGGPAEGTLLLTPDLASFLLTLEAATGTGAFARTSGLLEVEVFWPAFTNLIAGSVNLV